ncbi:GNAT family N-acetyltransferase [Flavisolibacter nicotianae]|uniref:GNAT family N-acetyltransferase n=1 Tax=Flavisolibacter nicotianae TaxID=2364882 RepID=UPI000EADE823|nr:GNAT family N-acetyltransferase [Flavisolibacter nicotianae]
MNIRPARPSDKPAMIRLLSQSLGDDVIPQSEDFWTWKHEQNPFGPSYVLLAEEDGVIVGLRAFMKWKWQLNDTTFDAIRAVDTATHPDFQGRGIFKKLTMNLVETCRRDGVHFIFNTPNEKSKPGYLKMGWVEQGKMPLKLKIRKPLAVVYSRLVRNGKTIDKSEDPSPPQEWRADVLDLLKGYVQKAVYLTTAISPAYIAWRYADNPLFRYNYFTDGKSYLLISRVKQHAFTKELRLVDFILLDEQANPQALNALLKKEVRSFCALHNINLVSMSGVQFQLYQNYFRWMGIVPVRALGPMITLRDLNMEDRFASLKESKNWSYSLGDLELF